MRLDQEPGVFAKIPVMSQGEIGNCYAYTAVQLIEAAYAARNPGQKLPRISPLVLSIDQKLQSGTFRCPSIGASGYPNFLFQSGNACEAIQGSSSYRLCREDALENYLNQVRERYVIGPETENLRDEQARISKMPGGTPTVADLIEAERKDMEGDLVRVRADYDRQLEAEIASKKLGTDAAKEYRARRKPAYDRANEDFRVRRIKSFEDYRQAVQASGEAQIRAKMQPRRSVPLSGDTEVLRLLYDDEEVRRVCHIPTTPNLARDCTLCTSSEPTPLLKGAGADALKAAAEHSLRNLRAELDRAVCRKNSFTLAPPPLSCSWKAYPSPVEVNRKLDAGQPVQIAYCSVILASSLEMDAIRLEARMKQIEIPRPDQSWVNPGMDSPSGKPYCRGHSSLVIGRRTNRQTGRCEFLLRNSWGTECLPDQYCNDPAKCYCDSARPGNFWIDADYLTRNAIDMGWLK